MSDIVAVLFDFGGVILTSPFEAFADYERSIGAPVGLIRTINSTNPDSNAWAKLERSEVTIDEFATLFESEALTHAGPTIGSRVRGRDVLGLIDGELRPAMVQAIIRCKQRFAVACLTNNVSTNGPGRSSKRTEITEVLDLFDHVVESSKVGIRKPEPAFYQAACDMLGVIPAQCVFLDDLGINLKPAAAMGMRTIKVIDPDDALDELEKVLAISLR